MSHQETYDRVRSKVLFANGDFDKDGLCELLTEMIEESKKPKRGEW